MKPVSLMAVALVVSALGCSDIPVAPTGGLESVQATIVSHRTAGSSETVPSFSAVGSLEEGIKVRVTTRSSCKTVVTAEVNRDAQDGAIDIVTHVSSDIHYDCGPIPFDAVVDYQIVIRTPAIRLVKTTVRVNMFEAHEPEAPVFLGRQTVVVCCSV